MDRKMARPPRVCMLIESYSPIIGGMESQARTLAMGLQTLGVPLDILTRRAVAELPVRETLDGVAVHRIGPVGTRCGGRWGMAWTALPWLVRHRRRYDVVFVPGFRTLGVTAVLARALTGKSCVLKADSRGEISGAFFAAGLKQRGWSPDALPVRTLMGAWRRQLCRADAFVSMSSEMTDEFVQGGVAADRIETIPNAVNTHAFRPASPDEKARLRMDMGIPAHTTVYSFTGRLVDYKGLPTLLKAWARFQAKAKQVLLLIAGGGGLDLHNCEAALRAFVVEKKLEFSVTFLGEVSDVAPVLQVSDIFVFPTEEEAFGLSLVEAMACGLPCISTTVGGLGDIVRDGHNARAVDAGSVPDLLDALRQLHEARSERARLARNAVALARDQYALDRVSRQYADLFGKVCGR